MLNAKICLLTAGRCQPRVCPEYRRRDVGYRRAERTSPSLLKEARRCLTVSDLLECPRAIFFYSPIQKCQLITVIKDAIAGAYNPVSRRTVGNADSRTDI